MSSSPSMKTSRNSNSVRRRSAIRTARALSHRPHVRREYMTTVCTESPSYRVCADARSGKKALVDQEPADLELHRRLRAGDAAAFEILYTRYGPSAYGLALR